MGEAALRDRRSAAAGWPLAQLQPQLAGDQLGVVEEDLVERADPEQQDDAGVLVAQLEVLADQLAVLAVRRPSGRTPGSPLRRTIPVPPGQ